MRIIKFICCTVVLFIINCSLQAQSKDTITAQKIIDKGSQGDILLGIKNKKDQLNNTPVFVRQGDSICRKDMIDSLKKFRRTQTKKGN